MTATGNDPRDTLGLIGLTIDDKYVVESVVGEGGFGVVYRATHKLWQKPVAIKCFKTLMDAAPAMRDQLLKDFIQEGALLSELSARTASIVQARDVGTLTTPNGAWVPYMVLEWLEGQTLEDWSEKQGMRPWPLELAMTILEPIATALDVAHARNIAHRDIKPANIFLCGDVGNAEVPEWTEHTLVKLLDFGIAKVVQSAADQGMTKTVGQVTAFTPSYGAPEQFSRTHGATGPWTDVYALALIFVELLTGKYALDGEDFIQLGMSSADPNRRPTPRTLGVDHGDALEAVLLKALAVKPTNRYQRAGQFWNDLRVSIGAQPLRSTTAADLRSATGPAGEVRYNSSGLTGNPPSGLRPKTGDPSSPRSTREAFAATAMVGSGSGPVSGTLTPNTASPAPTAKSKAPIIAIAAVLGVAILGGGAYFATRSSTKLPDDAKATATSSTTSTKTSASAAPAKPACPAGMALIEGGQFFMGSDDPKADDDEKPAHNVTLSPYCIDLHEVTTSEYKACSDGGKCKRAPTDIDYPDVTDEEKKVYGPLCNMNDPIGKAKHPINCVDWDMASIYCAATDKRLPTEAEWEFAARGPDGRIYPWGDAPPDERHLNACGKECVAWGKKNQQQLKAMYETDDGFPNTAPVGSFPMGASRYGLLDVVGNVWEWAADWEARYDSAAETDPKGPGEGTERVVRGGAWNGSFPAWVRPTQRYAFPKDVKSFAVGFRCAKPLK